MIRTFDFETTGFEPPAEVIEVGYADLKGAEISAPVAFLCGTDQPIDAAARAVHHIHPDDLVGLPKFESSMLHEDGITAFAAHNATFEIQFFTTGLPVICTYRAALRIWPDAPSHSNFALAYWLEDQGAFTIDRQHITAAHRAGTDAYATAHILWALIEAGAAVSDMVEWSTQPPLMSKFSFGKFKGQSWSAADDGYLRWIIEKSDMSDDIKWNAQHELDRR